MTEPAAAPADPPAERAPGLLRRIAAPIDRALVLFFLGLIRVYQWTLSPFVGRQCRFEPTCSRYFAEALRVHGLVSGFSLGLRRLSRCHPFGGHGPDPVPPRGS